MDQLLNVDWDAIFSPQHSLLELFLRGTIMYLVIFVLLRVVAAPPDRRHRHVRYPRDRAVAEVAGNGITDKFQSVVEGAVLVGYRAVLELRSSNGCSSRFPPSSG